ncbi:MAG: tetratricopeptide repeat protein [Polyangiaceae bacterium]|nr:tetratricopeptide repeat protein [Polyangiaceae bacterium]
MSEPLDSPIRAIRKLVDADDPTAIERATQLTEQYPDEPEAWFELAFVYSMFRDMDGAIAAMTRMKEVSPPDPSIFFFRGGYEHRRGDLEAALADFTEGIALAKQLQKEFYLSSLYFRRADVLVTLGRKAEALADLEHVEDDHVGGTTKLRNKFALLTECGQPPPIMSLPKADEVLTSEHLDALLADIEKRVQAESPFAFEQAVQLAEQRPKEPKVWPLLAYAHATKGDLDGAVAAITRGIEVTPPHPTPYFIRGHFEYERGNLQAALADFDNAVALAKQLQEEDGLEHLYFVRADVLAALGRKAEARADLEHVEDGYVGRTNRIRSKADILEDCEE